VDRPNLVYWRLVIRTFHSQHQILHQIVVHVGYRVSKALVQSVFCLICSTFRNRTVLT
jgi:hypothetical protein